MFHILADAVTHRAGNMLLWPFSITKYLSFFDFNSLPIYIIMLEQEVTLSVLILVVKRRRTRQAKQYALEKA